MADIHLPDDDKKDVSDRVLQLHQKIEARSRKLWLSIGAAVAVLVLGVFFLTHFSSRQVAANEAKSTVYVRVKPGMTADDVADILLAKDVINSKFSFWLQGKLNGADSQLKVGTYKLERGMDSSAVLKVLLSGKTSLQTITIPEGFTINEIAKRLEAENILSAEEFRAAARNYAPYDYMQRTDSRLLYQAEGFLFPDTYQLDPEGDAADLLAKLVENFDEQLTPDLRQRAAEQKLSLFELVTLASLVEKEAMFDEDRPVIAQVLLKRWEISMPLQSDASLQYLMDAPKEDVSIADTKIDSPYNTYQYYGLPPGPIANPGLASIKAVLYPANTDYLYFVADRQGHNHYSRTYDEHLEIVAQVR